MKEPNVAPSCPILRTILRRKQSRPSKLPKIPGYSLGLPNRPTEPSLLPLTLAHFKFRDMNLLASTKKGLGTSNIHMLKGRAEFEMELGPTTMLVTS